MSHRVDLAEIKEIALLIEGLWRGLPSVTLRTKDWQRLLLYYGADHLHMRAGIGYHLSGKRVGPGVYSVRFVEPPPRDA